MRAAWRERIPAWLRRGLRAAVRFVREVALSYQLDNGPLLAAGMAFYALLSLIPLLLLALTVLSWFYDSRQVQDWIAAWLQSQFPGGSEDTLERVGQFLSDSRLRWTSGLNLLGLLYAGHRFFLVLTQALNAVWEGERKRGFWGRRLIVFLAMLATGLFFGLSVLVGSVLAAARGWDIALGGAVLDLSWLWNLASYATPWGLSAAFFLLLYKFLPETQVPLRVALIAALFAGSLWEGLRYLVTTQAARLFIGGYGVMYGPLASVVLLMLWMYLASAILLLGAEVASVLQAWMQRAQTTSASA